ncbi:hypothetical protein [Flavobacterium aciduliphilum]|jgi:hypothetical protein|uniref:Uncharacterized protein n=1 Tax=Flavobacterium aciduliphilum TaxID=1101402 RepID=A0A328YSM9_9FLAO|nr:hypothetical protein [Flavobacterium aciduliphilum]RAR75785.1 hypothetical protein CLV55_101490 [Flavobacterium aciduliphilum]
MNANTVYDVFLALPEMEKQRHIQLVNEYIENEKNKLQQVYKKKNKKIHFTKQDAIDYLLKNVFTSKNKVN